MGVMSQPLTAGAEHRAQDSLRQAELEPLLAAVAAGDQAALAQLYDACSGWVLALALKLLADRQLAEEVTLDVFMQVWRRADTYEPRRGKAASWLLTIARSRALDALRARRARTRHEEEFPVDLRVAADGLDPLLAHNATDRGERVRSAIASLPEDQRRAIELAYFPGLSHSEIAARLGLPLGTIKTRIRLGMFKLRERLEYLQVEP